MQALNSSDIKSQARPPDSTAQACLDIQIGRVAGLFPEVALQECSMPTGERVSGASAENSATDKRDITEIVLKMLPTAVGSGQHLVKPAAASTLMTKAETKVAVADFDRLKSFWQKWSSRPVPLTGFDNAENKIFLDNIPPDSQLQLLEKLDSSYQILALYYNKSKVKVMSRQELAARASYPSYLSLLTALFFQMCLRDTAIQKKSSILYRTMYKGRD